MQLNVTIRRIFYKISAKAVLFRFFVNQLFDDKCFAELMGSGRKVNVNFRDSTG